MHGDIHLMRTVIGSHLITFIFGDLYNFVVPYVTYINNIYSHSQLNKYSVVKGK
jgi:hypothetical protein